MPRQALRLAAAAAMAATASATAAEPVEDRRETAAFSKVAVNGAIDTTIAVGEPRSVTIVTEPAQQGQVTTELRGETLVIETDDDTRFDAPVEARISVPALTGLAINGSSDVEARGIDSDEFSLSINGSGDAVLAGRCGTASFAINGSGDIAAKALECREGAVDIAGSGDVELFASESVAVEVNGSGGVEIWGGARLRAVDLHGSGDVTTHGR